MSHVKNDRNAVVGRGLERVEDRTLLSASVGGGNVNVSIVGQTVTITGDAHQDHIVVQQTPGGAIQVIGGTNTRLSAGTGLAVSGNSVFIPAADKVGTINVNFGDSLSTIAFCNMALPDVNVSAGNGNDKVLIAGCTGSSNVTISMGTGIDQLAIFGSSLGSLSSTMGSDTSTNADRVEVRGTQVSGAATIKTGGGNDAVMLASAPHNGGDGFGGDVNVYLGAGNNYFSANESTFSGNLNVNLGPGKNVAVGAVSVAGGISITGSGVNLIHRGL